MTKTDRTTSAGRFYGWHTIITDGAPYMTRAWFGRLRVHVFYRGDADQDPHDHPWDFWTFPLRSYVEEVTVASGYTDTVLAEYITRRQVVPAFGPVFRPATHTHRVIGPYSGYVRDGFGYLIRCGARRANTLGPSFWPEDEPGKIVTVVWRSEFKRKWGFLKHKDGRWCWQAWKDYALHGGKNAPCE